MGVGAVSWQGGKEGRVVRWQVGKGGRVVRRQGGKGGKVLRWHGGRFLVLFKGGRCMVSQRFHLFLFLMLINGTKGTGWVQDVHVWSQGLQNSPWILHKLLKI